MNILHMRDIYLLLTVYTYLKPTTIGFNFQVLSIFMNYHRVCNYINTTGDTSGTGTAYPSGAPEFTMRFKWGSCYSIVSFIPYVL